MGCIEYLNTSGIFLFLLNILFSMTSWNCIFLYDLPCFKDIEIIYHGWIYLGVDRRLNDWHWVFPIVRPSVLTCCSWSKCHGYGIVFFSVRCYDMTMCCFLNLLHLFFPPVQQEMVFKLSFSSSGERDFYKTLVLILFFHI